MGCWGNSVISLSSHPSPSTSQHSGDGWGLSIFPTCPANWYPRKLTSINTRNPMMRPPRQAGALKENLQRCLSVSLLYASWGEGGGFHYHQPPFEHPLSLFVSMLLGCCQHNIDALWLENSRKLENKKSAHNQLPWPGLHSPDLQQHYRCILVGLTALPPHHMLSAQLESTFWTFEVR